MKNLFLLKDKTILITGAGRGIGKHLACSLAEQSAIVYAIDKKFTKFPKKYFKQIHCQKCDITDNIQFKNICKKIFMKEKKIDVLINNAGVSYANQIAGKEYPIKEWLDTINVNLTASFMCSQEVIKYMLRRHKGSIINITSINAELGFPRNPAYNASQGGLKMLITALAKDWGKYGIRVNNLGPGYILTDMTKGRFLNKKTRKEREDRTILGRWGTVDDLVGPCIFLASDASSYITAQDIYVDGGWLANSGLN